jgi:hypothetical protein
MNEPKLLGCPDCQATGLWHCSDPLHCGGMRWSTEDEDTPPEDTP